MVDVVNMVGRRVLGKDMEDLPKVREPHYHPYFVLPFPLSFVALFYFLFLFLLSLFFLFFPFPLPFFFLFPSILIANTKIT